MRKVYAIVKGNEVMAVYDLCHNYTEVPEFATCTAVYLADYGMAEDGYIDIVVGEQLYAA